MFQKIVPTIDEKMVYSGFDRYYAYQKRDVLFALIIDHLLDLTHDGKLTHVERDCAILEVTRCIEKDWSSSPAESYAALATCASKYGVTIEGIQ